MPPDEAKPLFSWACLRLREAGCQTPELDARLLLEAAAGLSREALILDPGSRLAQE
ncbi:MAG: protein-(glutamine-N5) methyltransferase, release factor-specific, partial [Aestuariivirga sp.]